MRLLLLLSLLIYPAPATSTQVVVQPSLPLPHHADLGCDQLALSWDQADALGDVELVRASLALRAQEIGCCSLVPRLAHAIASGQSWTLTSPAREALSTMDCRVGNEELATQLRAALACEDTEADSDWLAVAAGLVAGPEEWALLREEWMRPRPSTCYGYPVVDRDDLALALMFTGDDVALQGIIALQDFDELYGWADDSRVVARAVCRLSATTRLHEVARLVARMDDEDQRDELILACIDLGCWLADDLAEPALQRRAEREADAPTPPSPPDADDSTEM